MTQHRVLAIAESADPEATSVPLVGWSHCLALSKIVSLHVATQVRHKAAIERYGWVDGEEFTAIDSEAVAKGLYKIADRLRGGSDKGWTTLTALAAPSYLYFEFLFWEHFKKDLIGRRFDLVHRITPLSPTTPSLLGPRLKKLGIPYVVGPLNGGLPWPEQYRKVRHAEREWLSYVRGAHRIFPGYRSLRKNASAIVVGSKDTCEQMPSWCKDRLVYIPENAIDPNVFPPAEEVVGASCDAAPLGIAFVGRLVPYKGADMLIKAAAPFIKSGNVNLDVIGNGPQRSSLETLVRQLGVESGVEFAGWMDHRDLVQRLQKSQVLGFPSIREFGGGVVLEAMALGLAPIVIAYGGPDELVTKSTGIALPLAGHDEVVASLREAISDLVSNRDKVRRLGQNARRRVHDYFTWEQKAKQSVRIYEWVLGNMPKPKLLVSYPDRRRQPDPAGAASQGSVPLVHK